MSHAEAKQAEVKRAWEAACKHDGIEPNSKFVVFSSDNPFVPYYEKALAELKGWA